ncbi:MAG: AraC family transcriptional regulator [Bacteroidota bacterium]
MLSNLTLTFPNFNIYSTPLLILALQGLIFAALLFGKYRKLKSIPYFILAFILLITCYHRTTYTIGFMDWYDTYRNTKINYYLVNLELILIPLIYFYVKSITTSDFKFRRVHLWHFVPGILYFLIKMFILAYDASQPGFHETQNGYLVQNFQWKYLDPFYGVLSNAQTIVYLVLSLQLYYVYRKSIEQYFSNTYRLELNWIRNFLLIYAVLFLYGLGQTVVNLAITELSWTQKWWLQFFNALAIIYVGVTGYFTDTDRLKGLGFDARFITKSQFLEVGSKRIKDKTSSEIEEKAAILTSYFERERPYLDPDLNLIALSERLQMSRAEVSGVINEGFGKNFNDYVNSYRVEAVKKMLSEGKQDQLSLLGIALECGFNSKATFNRVFKKITQQSPTQYLNSLA